MSEESQALGAFHPHVRRWFERRFRRGPTEVQERAWPAIAAGRHVLLSAPTGTGKTYAAFLYALNQLVTGAWQAGGVRVLYVSPLKALNTDIRENLVGPLDELRAYFAELDAAFPDLQVATRSGDTPGSERQAMVRRPPEILITTPESLNLILASPRSRQILSGVRAVILDEIHAVVGTKRGTHLITAVDRLVRVAGEFQRIGLSATIKPMEETARFLGGYLAASRGGEWTYERRPVEIVRSKESKEVSLAVRYLGRGEDAPAGDTNWDTLGAEIRRIMLARRSTLVFVNSRHLAERIAHLVNKGEEPILAYAHHGSLSKELRAVVERRLKGGELSGIVATSSLELGIDVGHLDEVLLVETPTGVSQTVQRLGRAGHGVGEVARGTLFPSHGMDLARAGVIAKLARSQEIEEIHPVRAPLDVLAQIVIGMVGVEAWKLDDLFAFLRSSEPYHALGRAQFDAVVEMLEGKYADSRVRELQPRVSVDRTAGVIRGRPGALYLLYTSGGTIPDRGYYGLHLLATDAKIGELDEEFVWERKVGDSFTLGTQKWRIAAIDHQKVKVVPWDGPINSAPFWRGEGLNRDFHFSQAIALAFEEWDGRAGRPGFLPELVRENGLDEASAASLESFLLRQREATRTGLPHRHRLVIERTSAGQVILHTLWGGRVNRPFALALGAVLRRRVAELDVLSDNDCVIVMLPQELAEAAGPEALEIDARKLLLEVASADPRELIAEELESSGFFGARFRESAGRALLLPKRSVNKRMPLWLTRLRAKKLLDRVRRYPDFPIVAEAWRTCIQDEFDLDSLSQVLGEIRAGVISVVETRTPAPSPFSSSLVRLNTGRYMYADDTPEGSPARRSALGRELLKEVVFSDSLRIRVEGALAREFAAKLARTAPGYAPRTEGELVDWLKERLLVPADEWRAVLSAMERDHGTDPEEIAALARPRIASLGDSVVALDSLPRIERAFSGEPDALAGLLAQWLEFYGPVELAKVKSVFARGGIDEAIDSLVEERRIVLGALTEGSGEIELCDAENLERLLAFKRRAGTPAFTALPLRRLPLFLASWQGLAEPSDSQEGLKERLDALFGYPARAELWEGEIFPARLAGYRKQWLDGLLAESDLAWFGCGAGRIAFRFSADAPLFAPSEEREADGAATGLFSDPRAKYTFSDLLKRSGLSSASLAEALWAEVWRGRLLCDSFEVVRRGVASGFRPEEEAPRARRSGFDRWQASRLRAGMWYLPETADSRDLLDEEERSKERARLLLDRYGIVFRELLTHELPDFRWASVFRSLRIMELSGEILSGSFFEGIPGLQFVSPGALGRLREALPDDAVYWMSAADPASLCGVELALRGELPSRLPSTRLVYHGERLVGILRRAALEIRVPPNDPAIGRYLSFARALTTRDFQPLPSVKIETVNGTPVRKSDYRDRLVEAGFREDFKEYTLWGR